MDHDSCLFIGFNFLADLFFDSVLGILLAEKEGKKKGKKGSICSTNFRRKIESPETQVKAYYKSITSNFKVRY